MNYRNVGNSGLKISEISIGGWLTYGGTVDKKKTEPIIKSALDQGINFIDLADIYTKGKAEEVIGLIIKDMTRSDLVISSKVFWPMSDNVNDQGLSRKHIIESVEKSLKRLQTDYLDIYFLHRHDPDVSYEEIARTMNDLVCQGKILYWGTSVWSADQIERLVGVCEKYNLYKPIVEQPRFNMIDRHIEVYILDACVRNGMGLTVWSPLAQGLLTGKYSNGIPDNSRAANSQWLDNDLTEENIGKVNKLTELASSYNLSISQLALAWILKRKEISCAIIGATKPSQVEDNVKASDVVLDNDSMEAIEKILDNKPTRPIMG
jgi:voltage-dependent potassium channel beta subunit